MNMRIIIIFVLLVALGFSIWIIAPHLAVIYFIKIIPYIATIIGVIGIIIAAIAFILAAIAFNYNKQLAVFNMVTTTIYSAISILESLVERRLQVNDRDSWGATASQLDAFHNLAVQEISNKVLREAYCSKMYLYHHRIFNILKQADNHLFYYGVNGYNRMTPIEVRNESFEKCVGVSPFDLICIMNFLYLIGPRRSGSFDADGVKRVFTALRSVPSEGPDGPSIAAINDMCLEYRNVYLYYRDYLLIS